MPKTNYLSKISLPLILFAAFLNFSYAQENKAPEASLFQAGQKAQKELKWQQAIAKFREVISSSPRSETAQKAHIEIGKFYKYNRDWQEAIAEYHQAVAILPHSRASHDAKTAEAAVYYFRQDFPRALGIFKEVLAETKDWDQVKYCSYWIKEMKRRMSFQQPQAFSCGQASLKIAFNLLGIKIDAEEFAALFDKKKIHLSLADLTKFASQKGLKPQAVKIQRDQLQNLTTPFIALVEPEHYIVVTKADFKNIEFIDPVHPADRQSTQRALFDQRFKGYCLVFLEDTKFAKANYTIPTQDQMKEITGGVCWCCPASSLGGSGTNKNTEFDGSPPCSPGMPSWMVNTVNLNFIIQDIDFRYTSRGMPIEFMRTYNADDPSDGVFGRSWTFNYNVSLVENSDDTIDVRRGDGRIDHFFWNGIRYQGPDTVYDSLAKNTDGTYSLLIKDDKTTQYFDSTGKLTRIKDRNNNAIAFTYNSDNNLTKIIDPKGKKTTLTYGTNKKVRKITLPDSRYMTFTYDANNNLIQAKDTLAAVASYTYDSASYITAITTPHRGKATITYTTDSEGYAIKSITDALSGKRSYGTYQTHSRIRVLDSRNNATIYDNNYEGYTEQITTAMGNKIIFGYDAAGNRTKIIDTLNNTTTLAYDTQGNVTSLTDALSKKTSLTYDSNNDLIKTTDPKGNIYNFTYDSKSNLLSVKDAESKTTSFVYNYYGQLTRIKDAKGQVTDFAYDTAGNLIKLTDPLGKITEYTYDTLGRLITLTDPKAHTFTYTYDGVDHLTKITYPDSTTAAYTYNCCNLIQATDKFGTLKFTYDALGRMKSFTNADSKVISYAYDSAGNLTTLTYPDSKKVQYAYDKDNRLITVTDWLGNLTQYNYDARGNLASSISAGLLSIYKYDTLSRLNKLLNYNAATMGIISGFEFTLDELGNRAQVKSYLPITMPSFPLVNTAYSYNSDNQLISATDKTFEYDNNGNLTKQVAGSTTTTFTYNYDNQLTQYASGATNLTYIYDALGSRIQKTSGSTITKYLVDPNRSLPGVLAETNSSGTITAYYVYGLGLISKIVGTNAYFYQYDGLGSTVAITDKTGAVKNKYAYSDFGELASNSTETISNPFKYVGRFGVMTDAADLFYMRARYYSPSIGRFLNKDPIGLAGGMNLYGYVGGNPIRLIDPSGLASGFCRLEDRAVWEQDDSIMPVPIWEDPVFLILTGFRFRPVPLHIGFDIPFTKLNILHLGKKPGFGKLGYHIGILFKKSMSALWHINF